MGYSNWSSDAYSTLSDTYAHKSADAIFAKIASSNMSPMNITIRESRDSDIHPTSLAVIINLDVTGSMGRIPESIVKNELGTLMNTIIDSGVKHPQILFNAIGDHYTDRYPLQVGQFESGTSELDKWLTSINIEGGGGGQNKESYLLAWLVGGRHTSIDCFEKRGEKGFLFTIGDEKCWNSISSDRLMNLMGYSQSENITDKQLLEEAQRLYNVYHIHVNETQYKDDPDVIGYWKDMLGERLIILNNHDAICATIATIIALQHGCDMSDVVGRFSSHTAGMVTTALATYSVGVISKLNDGVVTL